MRRYTQRLAGQQVRVNVLESDDDVAEFRDWWMRPLGVLGADSETSGLNIFSPGFELRTVQFGDRATGWVLRVEQFAHIIRACLRDQRKRFVVHNHAFDGLVWDRALGVTVEELAPQVTDSQIMSHLIDPRGKPEGGVGHALKDLARHYVDPAASDGQKELQAEFRKIGETKDTGWAKIAIDNPAFELYAGLDPILTVRVAAELDPLLDKYRVRHLLEFEHTVERILMQQQRRGVLVDVDYTRGLSAELQAEAEENRAKAAAYGVANINSTAQLATALLEMGADIPERTASGKVQVDSKVLQRLACVNADWEPVGTGTANPLAAAVLHAKRAQKWDTAYLGAFLELRDEQDRLHPSIRGLQARTGRMSISNPPLQQLPSGEWKIRRAMIADPGNVFASVDFDAQEMACLAMLSKDPKLVAAIQSPLSVHSYTAQLMFGGDFTDKHKFTTKQKKQYALAKMSGFARVYGGGAAVIQRQSGESAEVVKEAVDAYDNTYPGIKQLGYRLQEQTQYGAVPLVTYTGRRLPLDRDRTYAAINYVSQSLARDITAEALVRLDAAGFGEFVTFPIHDEVLLNVPAEKAAEITGEAARIMATEIEGVPFRTEGEIGKRSWGSLKGGPE